MAAATPAPLDAWKRLEEFEAKIEELFPLKDQCPKEGCPPGPRVHIVYAHHLARPDLDLNVDKLWLFQTLIDYDRRKAEKKPRSHDAAMDYLISHFLWVRRPGVIIEGLPMGPLEKKIPPTIPDGGTLVDFINRDFPKAEVQADAKGALDNRGEGYRVVKVTTPAMIDPPYIELYRDTVVSMAHARTAKDLNGKTLAEDPNGKVKAKPTPLPAPPAGPVEGDGYPRRRRLCLSLAGQEGDHKDVDLAPVVSAELAYHVEISHVALRLFCVAPGFNFELRQSAIPKKGIVASTRPVVGDKPVLGNQGDPWKMSTMDYGVGPDVWETTSNVWLGALVSYTDSEGNEYHGVQKPGRHTEGLTTTKDLGDRFAKELGESRRAIFRIFRNVEGPCEAVQTYDNQGLSWGINQWTAKGELFQILAYIYDFFPNAFARRFGYYGIGVWFSARSINYNDRHAPYADATVYRVPCCGPTVRKAIIAVRDAPKLEAQRPAPPKRGADLPPWRKRFLAEAMKIQFNEWPSFALCYVFTTAGADPEIQKAMAQWMSYRITACHPGGKKLWKVLWEFQLSLERPGPPKPEWLDENTTVKWIKERKERIEQAIRDDLTPDATRDAAAQKDPEIDKLRAAVDEAGKAKPPNPQKLHAAQHTLAAALDAKTKALVEDRLKAFKEIDFSDDDADEAWIRWPTRCADAGKSMSGNLQEQETWPATTASTVKADPAKGAPAKGAPAKGAPVPAKPAPAPAKQQQQH